MTDWRAKIDLFSPSPRQKSAKRTERVADILKNEIGLLLLSKIKDPRLENVSIVQVIVTKDLRRAKIFYSVYGDEQKAAEAAQGLASAKGFIRKHLAMNLDLRLTPELVFERDLSMMRQEEMEMLFKKLHSEDESID
jgi:ribosome-binding factor A